MKTTQNKNRRKKEEKKAKLKESRMEMKEIK